MSYKDDLRLLKDKNFSNIRHISMIRLRCRNLLDGLMLTPALHASLCRGVAILETEDQIDGYIHCYGGKHYRKFNILYDAMPQELFTQTFDVIDWACGAGLGIVSLSDFLKRLGPEPKSVRQITLIEPSRCALERAKINSENLFPNTFVCPLNKRFEDLSDCDFSGVAGVPRIHLFSNILDLDIFDNNIFIKTFTELVRRVSFRNDEIFVCVSPSYKPMLKQRFERFIDMIIDVDNRDKTFCFNDTRLDPNMHALVVRVRNQKLLEVLETRVCVAASTTPMIDACDLEFFHALVAANDSDGVKEWLQMGISPDIQDSEQWPAVVTAAKYDAVDVLTELLKAGANPNATTVEGATGLYFAAKYGHLAAVNMLITHKAQLDICTTKTARTPLFMASKANHLATVKALLNAGAHVDLTDRYEQTALYCAVAGGHFDVAQLLLQSKADPNLTATDGLSPLSLARAERNLRMLELMKRVSN